MSHDHGHEHIHEHEHRHCDDAGHTHHAEAMDCDGGGHIHHHHADGSCCCHRHEMQYHDGVNKPMLIRLAVATVLFFSHEILPVHEHWIEILLFAAVTVIAGYDVIWSAVKNLVSGRFFDEYFLMTFAAVAAFIIGNYHEAAAVMFLYRLGETCQDWAIRRSRRRIASVTGAYAPLEEEKGSTERFITRFAKIYTPVVLACALLIAVLLPVFGDTGIRDAVYRALTFLVVACPCAIVISVPMAYCAGIAAAAGHGIFFHDSTTVDRVAKGILTVSSPGYGHDGNLAISEVERFSELVLVGGRERFAQALAIAKKSRCIVWENIVAAVVVKLAVVALSALGISSLWFAVFADSGIAILLTLNSLRAFRAKGRF